MKKTRKALIGITALMVAFSTCALTACGNGQNSSETTTDGSIKGNYQVATTEEITNTLENLSQETLFGDVTAAGYKMGFELSSNFNFSMKYDGVSSSIGMSADYKMLFSEKDGGFTSKSAGNISMSTNSVVPSSMTGSAATNTSGKLGINLYQDGSLVYATLSSQSSDTGNISYKFKVDASQAASLIPSEDVDAIISSLPADVTSPDLSSLDLAAEINALNQMGATTSIDTTDGIKLKISLGQDYINSMMALIIEQAGTSAEISTDMISFSKCSLDYYLAIDRNGALSATSYVADIEATIKPDPTQTSAMTVKLNGYAYFTVNANVDPEIPANISSDASYFDITEYIPLLIESIKGSTLA